MKGRQLRTRNSELRTVRWFLPVLSGILWVLCFPKPDLGWLAWAALAPLFYFVERAERWSEAVLGAAAAGFVFYLGLLHWIYATCRTGGVAAPAAAAAWVALAAVMSLHWGLFGAGVHALRRLFGPSPAGIYGAWWVAIEWLSARWTTRFPWGLAGYTQWDTAWLLPSASAAGVYGLSFLVVSVNAAFALTALRRRGLAKIWTVPVLLLAGFAGLSRALGPRGEPPRKGVGVAVLQGNIDQYRKWDERYAQEILEVYSSLARQVRGFGLVVWPESALPGWLEDPGMTAWVSSLAEKGGNFHLVGAVSRQGGEPKNSAVLFGPDGKLIGFYHKRQLVPFGEKVPLQGLLGDWVPVLNELGGFSAGSEFQPELRSVWGRFVVGICYEAIFPHLMRHPAREGERLLVNLTNDGWYLDTAGPYQHFAMSVVRAAENRAYLIRAANTGISAVVDPFGRVLAKTRIGERRVLTARISTELAREAPGVYALVGDLFPVLCLGACLGALGLGALEKRGR